MTSILCTHCGETSTVACAACAAPYCSSSCQKSHWSLHQTVCGTSIDTAARIGETLGEKSKRLIDQYIEYTDYYSMLNREPDNDRVRAERERVWRAIQRTWAEINRLRDNLSTYGEEETGTKRRDLDDNDPDDHKRSRSTIDQFIDRYYDVHRWATQYAPIFVESN